MKSFLLATLLFIMNIEAQEVLKLTSLNLNKKEIFGKWQTDKGKFLLIFYKNNLLKIVENEKLIIGYWSFDKYGLHAQVISNNSKTNRVSIGNYEPMKIVKHKNEIVIEVGDVDNYIFTCKKIFSTKAIHYTFDTIEYVKKPLQIKKTMHFRDTHNRIVKIENLEYENQSFFRKYNENSREIAKMMGFKLKKEERVYSWEEAVEYCSSLDLNGMWWRVPTVDELKKIINPQTKHIRKSFTEMQKVSYKSFYSQNEIDSIYALRVTLDFKNNRTGKNQLFEEVKTFKPRPYKVICVRDFEQLLSSKKGKK